MNNNNIMLETPSGQVDLSVDKNFSEKSLDKTTSLCRENSRRELSSDNAELDSVVTSVMQKYIQRSLVGKKKYGTTLDRDDLTIVEWINHTQEELMDATLYLEKLKKTLIEKGLGPSTTDT